MAPRYFQKSFVNPLLALAFKEGVDFVDDPNYVAENPRQENGKWTVVVAVTYSDDDEDDEDGSDTEEQPQVETLNKPQQKPTIRDYEERFKKMIPIDASTIGPDSENKPCGKCLPCTQRQDCIVLINSNLELMANKTIRDRGISGLLTPPRTINKP